MRNTKSAFTLVELIVVITILAILGTIAFISLQGYSADARNSKRTSDLNNIKEKFVVSVAEGRIGNMDLVDSSVDNVVDTMPLGGVSDVNEGATYDAGVVNYQLLGIKEADFNDNNNAYAAGATTLGGGAYELAATMESDAGNVAKVTGTYNNRESVSVAWTIGSSATVFNITNSSDYNTLKVNDTVTVNAVTTTISKISKDYSTITVADDIANGNMVLIDEAAGLIEGATDETTPQDWVITDKGAYLPY